MTIHPRLKKGIIIAIGLTAFIGFILLGNWQLERREWKLDLIQRVDERVHATPRMAPSSEHWPTINRANAEYLRVSVTGRFLPNKDTRVVAATELGSGYWVITPFQSDDGSIVFINRGFISQGVQATPAPTKHQQVVGLLRMNEPDGTAVRNNDPDANHWYSRDVIAIAAKYNLDPAPYFIDAEKNGISGENSNTQTTVNPVSGLTVINFHNNHLTYAITWYGLALMIVGAGIIIVREEKHTNIS